MCPQSHFQLVIRFDSPKIKKTGDLLEPRTRWLESHVWFWMVKTKIVKMLLWLILEVSWPKPNFTKHYIWFHHYVFMCAEDCVFVGLMRNYRRNNGQTFQFANVHTLQIHVVSGGRGFGFAPRPGLCPAEQFLICKWSPALSPLVPQFCSLYRSYKYHLSFLCNGLWLLSSSLWFLVVLTLSSQTSSQLSAALYHLQLSF